MFVEQIMPFTDWLTTNMILCSRNIGSQWRWNQDQYPRLHVPHSPVSSTHPPQSSVRLVSPGARKSVFSGNILWKYFTEGEHSGVLPALHELLGCYSRSPHRITQRGWLLPCPPVPGSVFSNEVSGESYHQELIIIDSDTALSVSLLQPSI